MTQVSPTVSGQPSPAVAIALISLSIAAFAVSDAIVKWVAGDFHFTQIILVRSIVAVPIALLLLVRSGGFYRLRYVDHRFILMRVVFGTTSFVTFIQALKAIPLAEAVAVSFAGPLFITALSVPLLAEKVGPRRWAAVVIGFLGVVVILRPGAEVFQPAALWALASAAFYAMAAIATRKLAMAASTSAILVWVNAYVLVIMAAGVIVLDSWVDPGWQDMALLFGFALASTLGQYLGVEAFRRAAPSLLAPFDYTALVWAALLGFLIWNEIPSWSLVAGSAVLVVSGLYILHRESTKARRPVTGSRGLRRWR
jgi:drug/metabolite transporter (DMT)-like permease